MSGTQGAWCDKSVGKRRFSCLATTDRDVLVGELHSLLGAQLSREGCEFFLEIGNW